MTPRCIAPWVSVFKSPARMSPCCELTGEYDLEDLRAAFLTGGSLPGSCVSCLERKPAEYRRLNDGSLRIEDGLQYISIGPSNRCNLSCRMCWPGHSNTRHRHIARAGIDVGELPLTNHRYLTLDDPYFYQTLIEDNADTLKTVVIGGGEPMLAPGFHEILAAVPDHCDVHILTNGSYHPYGLHDALKRFKSATLKFSMDGVDYVNEYIRHGLHHDNLIQEINRTHEEGLNVEIHATITNYSVLRLGPFLKHLEEFPFAKRTCDVPRPGRFHPGLLPDDIKKRIMMELQAYPEVEGIKLRALKALMEYPFNEQELRDQLLDEHKLDQVMLRDFREVFPELSYYCPRIICQNA